MLNAAPLVWGFPFSSNSLVRVQNPRIFYREDCVETSVPHGLPLLTHLPFYTFPHKSASSTFYVVSTIIVAVDLFGFGKTSLRSRANLFTSSSICLPHWNPPVFQTILENRPQTVDRVETTFSCYHTVRYSLRNFQYIHRWLQSEAVVLWTIVILAEPPCSMFNNVDTYLFSSCTPPFVATFLTFSRLPRAVTAVPKALFSMLRHKRISA